MINDLRDFIARAEEKGQVKHVDGADWDLEIGLITEIENQHDNNVLLFDHIKGHEPGFRVATNLFNTQQRIAWAYGLPDQLSGMKLVKAMKERLDKGVTSVPPVLVNKGPVLENVLTGREVDLFKFPAPRWRQGDGGRFIGVNAVVITRDPEEGWINVAPYRVQVHQKNKATIFISSGHHGDMMRRKYWAQGQGCPVAVCCGQEPLIFAAAQWAAPWGLSELDYAGGLRGAPIEVVKGVTTGLPIPATAELVLEGEMLPPETGTLMEGPFGEWAGYYAGGARPEPVFQVNSVMFRNQPIIQGALVDVNPAWRTVGGHIWRAAMVWSELERQIPGVQGVWVVAEGGFNFTIAASIKQLYPGHAEQTAQLINSLATSACHIRYCIVVDEDIDPSNYNDLVWAIASRTNPLDSIQISRNTWTTPTNPMLSPEQREKKDYTSTTAHIIACRPWYWRNQFPATVKSDPRAVEAARTKWTKLWK